MKKVLYIMPLSRRAGLEVMFLNYLKYMKTNNPELIKNQYVLGVNVSEYFKNELLNLGVHLFEGRRNGKFDFSLIKLGKRIVKDNNINIIYGQNFLGNTLAALLSLAKRDMKIICHEHGTSWSVKGITSLFTLFWIKKADAIICNSKAAAILLRKRFNAQRNKLRVIYNGVSEVPTKNIDKSPKRLLFVGRLDDVKSPHTLLYMMKQLVQKDDQIILDILGEGKYEIELKKLSKSLELTNNVIFHGNVENVSDYMKQASLLILPSVREAFGNVIIEAAFQETPVVASQIDGIPEVVINGKTGVLIKPTKKCLKSPRVKYVVDSFEGELVEPKCLDPNKLSDEIFNLLQNDTFIKEMGLTAKEHVLTKFSMKRYYNEILSLLM